MSTSAPSLVADFLRTARASQHVAADLLDRFGEIPAAEARVLIGDGASLVAALEAVLALAGAWRNPEDDGLPSSALTEDRDWVRAKCADSLSRAIESALRGTQGGEG